MSTHRKKCGTYAGVSAHYQAKEPMCDECRLARAIYAKQRRRRADFGMPISGTEHTVPVWRDRPELEALATAGPIVDQAWKANA